MGCSYRKTRDTYQNWIPSTERRSAVCEPFFELYLIMQMQVAEILGIRDYFQIIF
jgi:hypothetical protein